MRRKIVIGVTGGIASGKNEVCKILSEFGAKIIDADKIGHNILKGFGPVNKKKLAKLVFSDKKMLMQLESITHPLIYNEIVGQIKKSKTGIFVINAAVLKKIGLVNLSDKIIVVESSEKIRIARLISKRKMTKSDALARIAMQASASDYNKIGDEIIVNNGTLNNLYKATTKSFAKVLLSLS